MIYFIIMFAPALTIHPSIDSQGTVISGDGEEDFSNMRKHCCNSSHSNRIEKLKVTKSKKRNTKKTQMQTGIRVGRYCTYVHIVHNMKIMCI